MNDNFLHGTHVKDTLSALKEEYQYLGPAHGAALISSHYLFNIYHFGLGTHSTTLVTSLPANVRISIGENLILYRKRFSLSGKCFIVLI